MTHICVSKLTVIGSDNGLSPGQRQAIIWTNAGILLIGPPRNKLQWIFFIEIHTFPFKKIHMKMSSGKWRPFCLGLNVLILTHITDWLWLQWPWYYTATNTQHFPGNMNICILLCFIVVWKLEILLISFRVISLPLGQSYAIGTAKAPVFFSNRD